MVALKIAHPELASDAEFVRRFIDEARSVARLSSPNVVAVFDQGSDGDIHYIAMEYVPGRTLRELLVERGRLSPRESLDIIEGVLTGLAAAHQAGIVHRDVKPENVLLGPEHAVKVADFGLARAAARVSQHQDRHDHRHRRLPGARAGVAQRLRRADRRLRGRRDAVRDAHRRAAAQGRVAARDRLQARQRGRPGAVQHHARAAPGAGRPGRAGHQPRSGPAPGRRRAVPAGRHRGAPRTADRRAARPDPSGSQGSGYGRAARPAAGARGSGSGSEHPGRRVSGAGLAAGQPPPRHWPGTSVREPVSGRPTSWRRQLASRLRAD